MMGAPVPLPGGPLLPLILSSPVLSLSPSPATCIHLHTAPNLSPALSLVRIPLCLYPSPLEHGSRQWGDRHNSRMAAYLYCWSLFIYVSPARVARKLSHDQSNSDLYGPTFIGGTHTPISCTKNWHMVSRSCLRDISLKGTTVFFHVL